MLAQKHCRNWYLPAESVLNLKTLAIAPIMLAASVAPALADPLRFTLINASPYDVKGFYLSPVGINDWEEDVFGDGYLSAGSQVTISVDDGRDLCIYDMRFLMPDDSEFVEKAINVCDLSEYTLSASD